MVEDGKYKQKELGESYTTNFSTSLASDDFSSSGPQVSTTPFTDNFTQADGADSLWTVQRGTFSVVSNEYSAVAGSTTLAVPTDSSFLNWTDYRLTAKYRRLGAADVYGYSLVYLRTTNLPNNNGYAILLRQTGDVNLYKMANGTWGGSGLTVQGGTGVLPKDNDWHNIRVLAVGPTIKIWLDKTEDQIPDIVARDSSPYLTGTIGLGTHSWASVFDDVQVQTLGSSSNWSDKRGVSNFGASQFDSLLLNPLMQNLSILSDSSSPNWANYKIETKMKRLGAIDTTNYSILYFRVTMLGETLENAYALIFRQTGTAGLYRISSGWGSPLQLGSSFNIAKDNNFHDVIVLVDGPRLKVWFDTPETSSPTFEFTGLTDYAVGTVGLGTYGMNSSFDDFSVTNNTLSLTVAPEILYTDSAVRVTVSSTVNFDTSLTLTVTDPSNTTWTSTNPTGCSGTKSCQVTFPSSSFGANLTTLGTYRLSATNGNDSSTILFEVREKPLLTFVQMTDTHINHTDNQYITKLNNFVADTTAQKYFPLPSFVVLTGDLIEGYAGATNNEADLVQLKTALDGLGLPYYPIGAGHDSVLAASTTDNGQAFLNVFGANRFSYSWSSGNFLFLAMDEAMSVGGYGSLINSTEHKTWLQNTLNANPNKYVFLFTHEGFAASRDGGTGQGFWASDGTKATDIRSILESHGKVIAEFSGHSHTNGLGTVNNIYYSQTDGFMNSTQYRYVEVYSDRIESHIFEYQLSCPNRNGRKGGRN